MGWTYEMAPQLTRARSPDVQQYVSDQVVSWCRDGSGHRVIESAMVGATWYGAVQVYSPAGDGETFGLVVHTRRHGRAADGFTFGYKLVSEDMGPRVAQAPMRILSRLSPTTNASALDWRQRCLDHIKRRRARGRRNAEILVEGAKLRLPQPIRFSDGVERQRFVLEEREAWRFRFRCRDTRALCRLSAAQRARLLPDDETGSERIGLALSCAA